MGQTALAMTDHPLWNVAWLMGLVLQGVVTYISPVEAFVIWGTKWNQAIKVAVRDQSEIRATEINGSTTFLRY